MSRDRSLTRVSPFRSRRCRRRESDAYVYMCMYEYMYMYRYMLFGLWASLFMSMHLIVENLYIGIVTLKLCISKMFDVS